MTSTSTEQRDDLAAAGKLIDEPGVYRLPVELYHADPVQGWSLSSTAVRTLLPPGCPARYHYDRMNGTTPKAHYDLGHAAHLMVLGAGPQLVEVDADDWRTKAAKEARAAAHAAGHVPLLSSQLDQVKAMADALRQHPVAGKMFAPELGEAEVTLVWHKGGVWNRALLDYLSTRTEPRLIVPDYKTADSAEPGKFARAAYEHGYHVQAAMHLDGVVTLDLAPEVAWVWVVQEKTPPYLVTVCQPSEIALRIGRDRVSAARHIFASCLESGVWPGYADDSIEIIDVPGWVEAEYIREGNLR